MRTPTPLAHQFARLILAALLPVFLIGALVLAFVVERERQTIQRSLLERARALSTTVDEHLRSDLTTLEALATSQDLSDGNLAAFHTMLRRALPTQPDWRTMHLSDSSGRQVLNALRPYGEDLPQVPDAANQGEVLRLNRPTVGNVSLGPVTGKLSYAMRVPVKAADGSVRYVLTAVIDPQSIAELLGEQRFPSDWVGVVLDGNEHNVARTLEPVSSVGKPAAESLRRALAGGDEGFIAGTTLEGVEVYAPFMRSAFSGWSVAIGVPRSSLDAAAWQAAGFLAVGFATTLLLALGFGWWSLRRIGGPIGLLAERAQRLGAGEPSPGTDSGFPASRELALVEEAFDRAAAAVQERDRAKQLFETMAHNAALALFVLDEAGTCVYLNPAAAAMCGFSAAEAQGQALPALLHLDPHGELASALAAHLPRCGEDSILQRAGARLPVAFAASPLTSSRGLDGSGGSGSSGGSGGTVVELRDISEELARQRERAGLFLREQSLRAQAENDNRAKDEFLAMLGHELRNPLAALSNAAHLLRLQPGGDVAERARGVIERQLAHLGRMVDDLLDVARVATGKIALLRSPLDLAVLVARVAEAHERAGRGARHPLHVTSVPCWVDGDETRLEQVLANLLGNAVRYSPAGGAIDLVLSHDGAQVVLTLRDQGLGIAPDMLPRVFDLFAQGQRPIERSQGGLGLGLTLVQRLVQMHGGSVEAASDGEGQGSTFTVRLPRIEPPTPEAPVHAVAAAPAAARRRRVLLVEDNADARSTMADVLQAAGHAVVSCGDGESAIESALRDEPDVALIDIGLPGASGLEVARRIRESQRKPMLLIALSGYGQQQDRERSIEAGFDLHEPKPIDLDSLLHTIDSWPMALKATAD